MKRSFSYHIMLIVLLMLLQTVASSQLSVAGPDCVVANTEYQYNLSGNLSSASTIKWCITGGVMLGNDSSCTTSGQRHVRVKWVSNSGSISVQTTAGDAVKKIQLTKALESGNIDSSIILQEAKQNSSGISLTCSLPTGGSCDPKYEFQWEQSTDGMSWKAINGADKATLELSSKAKQTTYYRRKVKDMASNSEAVSNTAIVIVKADK